MTELLEKAIARVAELSEDDQNQLAAWILEELESERRWSRTFEQSQEVLARLAEEALEEHHDGRTQELAPDQI